MTNETQWDVNAPWLRAHAVLGNLSVPLDERVNNAYAILGEALASAPSASQPTKSIQEIVTRMAAMPNGTVCIHIEFCDSEGDVLDSFNVDAMEQR